MFGTIGLVIVFSYAVINYSLSSKTERFMCWFSSLLFTLAISYRSYTGYKIHIDVQY